MLRFYKKNCFCNFVVNVSILFLLILFISFSIFNICYFSTFLFYVKYKYLFMGLVLVIITPPAILTNYKLINYILGNQYIDNKKQVPKARFLIKGHQPEKKSWAQRIIIIITIF